jgi:hypothetical protein
MLGCCLVTSVSHVPLERTNELKQGWDFVGNIIFWYMVMLIFLQNVPTVSKITGFYIYIEGAKKMYTHFKRDVDTLVNVAQALVRRNQKCLDADGNHFEHLL